VKNFYVVLFLALFPILLISGGLSDSRAATRNSGTSPTSGFAEERPFFNSYAGSDACMNCHQEIYRRFKTTPKASTRTLVEKMLPKLTGEEQKTCFQCHATGYGRQSGFVSYAQTPHLGDIGCEACHGPGSAHILSHTQDGSEEKPQAGTIRMPEAQTCASCHIPERGGAPASVRMFSGDASDSSVYLQK
jgi:hypothetical protein